VIGPSESSTGSPGKVHPMAYSDPAFVIQQRREEAARAGDSDPLQRWQRRKAAKAARAAVRDSVW
jgi:hypothetical protein